MKAGGVQVVATYVFWIHHEEIEGQFDWTGQRDLRHFVNLCHQDGLYVYLRIRYAGDVARLSLDGRLLDDDFYNGRTWEIGLKRFLPDSFGKKLEVSVLPLPRKAPIYLDALAWEPMNAEGQTGKVLGVELVPEYEVVLNPSKP